MNSSRPFVSVKFSPAGRELVRDLAAQFRTRIELRQIGVRDEARTAGRLRLLRPAALLHDFPADVRACLDRDGEALGA